MRILSIHVAVLSAILSSSVVAESDITLAMNEEMSSEASAVDAMATTESSTVVIDNLSNDFSQLLGENAEAVVTGLRNGEEFTLSSTTTTDGVQVTESATITPPTGTMGFGNVSHTLALTEYQLAQLGITDPTVLELEAALLGGSVTLSSGEVIEMQGVLALRSEGMGWGQIAQQYDTKLGHVISAIKRGRPIPVSTTETTTAASGTTGSQLTGQSSQVRNVSNGNAGGHGYKYGQGITTATGGSIGAGYAHGRTSHENGGAQGNQGYGGNGHAYGSGIVSANGASVSHGAGSANAGGNGNGRGRSK
jgi:hypothetical protein